MSSANQNLDLSYGLSQPIVAMNPRTIIAKRNPGNSDMKPLGTIWVNISTNGVYILSSITGNVPNWANVTGAAGLFTSVTSSTFVQAGTNIVAQTGNISATAGSVSAGTTVTAGTSITATAGNITATNGNVVLSTAATYVQLPGPIKIMSGAGAPGAGLAAEAGDLYLRTDPAGATSRIYVATAANTWTNVTCAA